MYFSDNIVSMWGLKRLYKSVSFVEGSSVWARRLGGLRVPVGAVIVRVCDQTQERSGSLPGAKRQGVSAV